MARTPFGPLQALTAIKERIRQLDRELALARVETMEALVWKSLAGARLRTSLVAVYAGLALVLASGGLYGLLAYLVASRVREIGIRMVLGAGTGRILQLVVGRGMVLSVLGVVIGLGIALASGRVLSRLLCQVSASEPLTYLGVGSLLVMVALLACYIPARRAARLDPWVALRHE